MTITAEAFVAFMVFVVSARRPDATKTMKA
jgi:hypothetical protein